MDQTQHNRATGGTAETRASATMANSSDEKALDLLARAIAEEIWRGLLEEPRRADDLREAGGRDGQNVGGKKTTEKTTDLLRKGRVNHSKPAN